MSGLELRLDCPVGDHFRLQVDCELPARGITAVYGPSGSGKSTLLDCIAGLRRPAAASFLRFQGEDWQAADRFIPPWRRQVAYVFQDARLFPHLDVRANLAYASHRRGPRPGPDLAAVVAAFELAPLLAASPANLSAGQKQRVAIARALLSAPRLLLLDEPLANLDPLAREHCAGQLRQLAREQGIPMVYVSHDIEEVSQLADYLLLLEAGRVVDQGPLLDLCGRLDTRLSREEQAAAILVGSIGHHDPHYGLTGFEVEGHSLLVARPGLPTGQQRRLRIPARDVSVCRRKPEDSSILNILPVTLSQIEEEDGARVLLRLALGNQFLLARITRKSAVRLRLEVGDRLFAQIKSAALLTEAFDHRD